MQQFINALDAHDFCWAVQRENWANYLGKQVTDAWQGAVDDPTGVRAHGDASTFDSQPVKIRQNPTPKREWHRETSSLQR